MRDKIKWTAKRIDQLSSADLLEILKARQEIFIIEQKCIYPDIDDNDYKFVHFIGRSKETNQLLAYSRISAPNTIYQDPSIGRIFVTKEARGLQLGKFLIEESINYCQKLYPDHSVFISAQLNLETYYQQLGFKRSSEPYEDYGIMHVDMILNN